MNTITLSAVAALALIASPVAAITCEEYTALTTRAVGSIVEATGCRDMSYSAFFECIRLEVFTPEVMTFGVVREEWSERPDFKECFPDGDYLADVDLNQFGLIPDPTDD